MRRPTDQVSKTHPRGSPPLKPGTPGQRSSLGLKVTADIKNRLDAAARANGRSQSQEAEVRIEWSFDSEKKMGGRRSQHLFEHVAQVPQILFEDESQWLDDRDGWELVWHLISQTLEAHAPPSFSRQELIGRARRTVDAYRHEGDRQRRSNLQQRLLDWSIDPRLPGHVRIECAGAAALEEPVISSDEAMAPPVDPELIAPEQVIESGRQRVAALAVTSDPGRRAYLQDLLGKMAQLEGLPEAIRDEFLQAATSTVVPLPSSTPPAGPVPDERRPRHVHLFDSAWRLAAIAAGFSGTPDEVMIAQAFAADPSLFEQAEMGNVARSVEAILQYRGEIERQRAEALAEPSRQPAKRRRSSGSAVAKS